jgi:hypothetical protein
MIDNTDSEEALPLTSEEASKQGAKNNKFKQFIRSPFSNNKVIFNFKIQN